MYRIEITSSAEKEMDKLSADVHKRVANKILELENNPRPPRISQKLVAPFEGYRLRIGNYRVLYVIDEKKKKVVVYSVRHRREAYRK
jgi:mRNA interferase RelE/StbE